MKKHASKHSIGNRCQEKSPCIGQGGDFPPLRRLAGDLVKSMLIQNLVNLKPNMDGPRLPLWYLHLPNVNHQRRIRSLALKTRDFPNHTVDNMCDFCFAMARNPSESSSQATQFGIESASSWSTVSKVVAATGPRWWPRQDFWLHH